MTEMKTLTIDDKTYEVVDAQAREDVSKLSSEISNLKTSGIIVVQDGSTLTIEGSEE